MKDGPKWMDKMDKDPHTDFDMRVRIVDASLVRCQCDREFGSVRGLRIHQRQ